MHPETYQNPTYLLIRPIIDKMLEKTRKGEAIRRNTNAKRNQTVALCASALESVSGVPELRNTSCISRTLGPSKASLGS